MTFILNNSFLKKVFALMAVLGLISCATNAQRQSQLIQSNTQSAGERFKSCLADVRQSPDYAALLPHFPLNINDATMEQMTDERKATKIEIKAIYATHPHTQMCRKLFADNLMQITPTLVPILVSQWQKWDSIEIDIIKKRTSWGDALTHLKDVATDTNKELMAAAQQIDGQLRQANALELQQRQQALDNAAQYFQNQQIINNMNRPVTTNCTGFGRTVNCTTY